MAQRIVAIDDDLAILALLHDALGLEGYRVAGASTTEAGRIALHQEGASLIILDARLETPDAGWRLLDQLRTDPATAEIAIIVCSADHRALRTHANHIRDHGCLILEKPFDLDNLLEVVAAALATPPGPRPRAAWADDRVLCAIGTDTSLELSHQGYGD